MSGNFGEILCWLEIEEGVLTGASLELLGEAAEIASIWQARVVGLVLTDFILGRAQEELAATAGKYGADELRPVEHPALAAYSTEAYGWALSEIITSQPYSAVLAPASSNGSDLFPRLAARLDLGLVTDCLRLAGSSDGKLHLTRPVYGDRLHAVYEAEANQGRPVLATFRPGSRGLSVLKGGGPAQVRSLTLRSEPGERHVTSLGVVPPDPRTVDIVEAERIVAVGLGVSPAPGIEQAQALAGCLQAALGATRPVVDKGWLPFPRQIGTTGRSVSPRLYLALGISGAGQHTGGLRGAKIIISVNQDRSAPMMALADLPIVGDTAQIVPILIRKLQERQAGKSKIEDQKSKVESPV
jgi:electron transfer flavoprotein alpha subunit